MNAELIELRKPVWLALSEFYTSPRPQLADCYRIAVVLGNVGITYAAAKEINATEVAPAFMGSVLYAFYPPFMWGVEPDDLYAEILRRHNLKQPPKLLFSGRLWRWLVEWVAGRDLENLRSFLA